jgi:CubicO group peptidase (beta-lactamase class C family)
LPLNTNFCVAEAAGLFHLVKKNRVSYIILFSTVVVSFLFTAAFLVYLPMNEPEVFYDEKALSGEEVKNKAVLHPDSLAQLLSDITSSFNQLGPINSLIVSQHGEIVTEQYYGRMHGGRGQNIKSASKSVLSILVGIAIDKGYLEGVDQTIEEFFPEYFTTNPDSLKASITIEDLLTMRSGLASTSRANYGRWVTSSNWIQYTLERPLQGTPGVDRIYSTGNTHLLAVILARASDMSLLAFSNHYLFHPMDIRITGWDRDPQGYYFGGNNMAMRPGDMVKIGRLMMNAGIYNGQQIVSSNWIIKSVKPVTGRISGVENYGYLWFQREAGDYQMYYAFGNGGQYILMVPELDSVITVTTRNESGLPTRNYRRELMTTIDREIIPLLQAAYSDV